MSDCKNLVWHRGAVTREHRNALNGHRSAVVWFTGLSGSGKSTLAHAVEERLHALGCRSFVLDGDNVRHGLCADLSFSPSARKENIRRIGEAAKLMMEAGLIALTAFISPFREDRAKVRDSLAAGDFIEIYCHATLETCEARDCKGFYRRARAGEIANYTGISSPYEPPDNPNLDLDTDRLGIEECVGTILEHLRSRGCIPV